MHNVMDGYRGLRYLFELNLDRVLTIGAVSLALTGGAVLGGFFG